MGFYRRLPDWHGRLLLYSQRYQQTPFSWGESDCGMWAAGAVDAMCGTSLSVELGSSYKSFRGAGAFLASRGWRDLPHAIQELLRCDMQSPGDQAPCTGDLVVLPPQHVLAYGSVYVCLGDVYACPAKNKLQLVKWENLRSIALGVFHV